jgi:hypothetical protein
VKNLPHLLTFPRTGSHYLDKLIHDEMHISIEKSHSVTYIFDKEVNKNRTVITIARDPMDSLFSYIALSENNFGPADPTRIEQIVTEYVLMHNFLYEHADIVIDFKDLVERPEATLKKVLELIDIKEKDYHLFDTEYNTKHPEYVESSKILRGYKKHKLDDFNMELCYFHYNRLLEKKIII